VDAAYLAVCSRAILRAILYSNLFLFLLFVIPITHHYHWVDQGFFALRSSSVQLGDFVGHAMQTWVVKKSD
jgi:hypothetical protein